MKTHWFGKNDLPLLSRLPPGTSCDYEIKTQFLTFAELREMHAAIVEAIAHEDWCPACADAEEHMAAPPAKLMDGFVAMFPNLLRPGRDYNVAENKSGTLIVKRPRADEVEEAEADGDEHNTERTSL